MFSQQVDGLAQAMIRLRVQMEAAIDFADEPLETLSEPVLLQALQALADALDATLRQENNQPVVGHIVLARKPTIMV